MYIIFLPGPCPVCCTMIRVDESDPVGGKKSSPQKQFGYKITLLSPGMQLKEDGQKLPPPPCQAKDNKYTSFKLLYYSSALKLIILLRLYNAN